MAMVVFTSHKTKKNHNENWLVTYSIRKIHKAAHKCPLAGNSKTKTREVFLLSNSFLTVSIWFQEVYEIKKV